MAKLLSIFFMLLALSSALPLAAVLSTSSIQPIDRRATVRQELIQLVNAERKKAGCKALTANGKIAQAAQKHSADMAARNYFSHVSPEGEGPDGRLKDAGYKFSSMGENIVSDVATPAAAVKAWIGSEGHRANMLNCVYTETGAGAAQNANGKWYWTQVYAHPA